MEYGCLGYCGICFEGPFALVNGEVVQGATVEELVNNVYEYLDENQCFKVLRISSTFSIDKLYFVGKTNADY